MKLPKSAKYIIVGGGVHGLSTAWHLAMELEATGKGTGRDIILLEKSLPGHGASGVACGCVRNLYMTEPMHALIRHSVDVWNYDPVALGFQQVGYVSCGEANQMEEYEKIHKNQNAVGYPSDLYQGKDAHRFLTSIWPDFKYHSVDVVLHEKLSGYAGTAQAINGLKSMCERHLVRIYSGVEVLDYDTVNGQLSAVQTSQGLIQCEVLVLGLGAWTPKHWELLHQPSHLDVGYLNGEKIKNKDMWTYWRLEEGELYFDGPYYTAENLNPPVIHIELMNTPVVDALGKKLKDYVYVYWKNGTERMERPGIQGGGMPVNLGNEATVDPYGNANQQYQADHPEFADYISACMGMFMKRFEGIRAHFKERPNGGIGAFTPDNIPILDWVLPNVYMIADSNHGFKALGIGKLVSRHIVSGLPIEELKPFSFSRYAEGKAFGSGVTNSPWV
ncbi:MAG: FAD-binding oxidoreductase [SAR324 cluster bacterium]|nr:FAD-binding oxidoreductase [SAR324 cluster bacterium]